MQEQTVREHAIDALRPRLSAAGVAVADVRDDFHLLDTGVLDSLSMVEFLEELQGKLGVHLALDDVDPIELFTFGSLVRVLAKMS